MSLKLNFIVTKIVVTVNFV